MSYSTRCSQLSIDAHPIDIDSHAIDEFWDQHPYMSSVCLDEGILVIGTTIVSAIIELERDAAVSFPDTKVQVVLEGRGRIASELNR